MKSNFAGNWAYSMESEIDGELSLFPVGTEIYEPDGQAVTIFFPTADDAIIFFQFMDAFARGEYTLYAAETEA